jgi:hypothetical protein
MIERSVSSQSLWQGRHNIIFIYSMTSKQNKYLHVDVKKMISQYVGGCVLKLEIPDLIPGLESW